MDVASSSPFVDNPHEIDEMTVSKLQFQIKSLQTEKQLLEQNRISMAHQYEETIRAKNAQLASLQANFDYVFDQKNELESMSENQRDVAAKQVSAKDSRIDGLETECRELKRTLRRSELKCSELAQKLAVTEKTVTIEQKLTQELKKRNSTLNEEIASLYETNQQLLTQANTNANANSESSVAIINNLHLTIEDLKKENNNLKLAKSKLLQEKTSVEVLKQKNITMAEKLKTTQALEERCCKLEIENIELNQKFADVFQAITENVKDHEKKSSATLVYDFLALFRQTKNENLVLQDKLNVQLADADERRRELSSLLADLDHLKVEYSEVDNLLKRKDETIEQLERQSQLNIKEIEFLRKSLKEDQAYTAKSSFNPAIDEYLSKLEKSVDQLRSENDKLRKKATIHTNVRANNSPAPGSKRLRTEDDDTILISIKQLQKENIDLSITVQNLRSEISQFKARIKSYEEVETKKKELNVLQLKLNPISKDQFVKQQTLTALRKENEDLIAMYIQKSTLDDLIPKSVFERQEVDKQILQSKIDQLSKRLTRLRDTYSQKSKDILSIISKYFGYVIEFLPSPLNPNDLTSRLKLTPKAIQSIDKSSYVIIDTESKNLKAYGNHVFKQLFDEINQEYDDPSKKIPCLLSSITLKVYDKYK